ncbi:protein FAM170A-like [Myotis daubentonii]|uniref:protein FAM170A-like n=1 Tax=Myotis daubentonii TaxID=98922 RepID=UPI002873E126|nr:protein FAM170A-like [Myotis daubentonii]
MKHKEKKKHLESKYFIKTARMSRGPCKAQQDAPQSFVEAPGCSQAAGENTSSSEYFTCVSSPYKLAHHEEDEPGNIQGDVPQTQSFMEAPGYNQAAGENASSSEYFTCVSSPSKLPRLNEDGIKERPVPKDLVETKSSSDYTYTYSSSPSASNKDPFMSSVHGTDLRLMKIYYTHVQMKRGVAVLCQTEEGWEPPSKKTKIEEMTYIEEVHKNVPLSHTPGKNLPIDPEPSVDSRAQEMREKADCPTKPPTQVVHRRVSLRKALESGFRCMACCHVFPTLELLQEHVENGVREGFSCHVFHRAMAHMKYKRLKRKNKKLMKATLRCQEEKHFDTKTNLKN